MLSRIEVEYFFLDKNFNFPEILSIHFKVLNVHNRTAFFFDKNLLIKTSCKTILQMGESCFVFLLLIYIFLREINFKKLIWSVLLVKPLFFFSKCWLRITKLSQSNMFLLRNSTNRNENKFPMLLYAHFDTIEILDLYRIPLLLTTSIHTFLMFVPITLSPTNVNILFITNDD